VYLKKWGVNLSQIIDDTSENCLKSSTSSQKYEKSHAEFVDISLTLRLAMGLAGLENLRFSNGSDGDHMSECGRAALQQNKRGNRPLSRGNA
jgi:hypothetical protein